MKHDSNPIWKYLVGVVCGIVLTSLYVRFNWSLPGILQLGGKAASEAVVTTAEIDLFDHAAPLDVRRRALAVVMGQRPELFLEVEEALDGQILEEVLRRKAERKAKLLKHRPRAYDMALEQPALRELNEKRYGTTDLEKLKRRMMIADLQREEYLHQYLSERFPDATDAELLDIVLGVYEHRLRKVEMVAGGERELH